MVTRWFSQRPVLVLRHSTLCRGHVRRQSTGLTNILATGVPPPVQVDSVTQSGVRLADGLVLPSACIFLDGKVFLWDVPSSLWTGWSMDHFEIFKIVYPRPGEFSQCRYDDLRVYSPLEILLFGTGLKTSRPPSFIRDQMSALGIHLDVMDTVCVFTAFGHCRNF
jgi:NADH dehydrogenase [ubiquinone] 1 alpha subcomplex assembly factor 3